MSKNKDVKTATSAPDKLKRKKYEAELATLQAELVALQEWVKATGAKICIVFEGGTPRARAVPSSGSWSG